MLELFLVYSYTLIYTVLLCILAAPSITSFQYASSATKVTLTCTSTNSPATNVSWMRDGETLLIDGVKNQFYQTVTSRRSSTYQNILIMNDAIENTTGIYTCNVTNVVGSSSSNLKRRGRYM